jgi:hypothetical protein
MAAVAAVIFSAVQLAAQQGPPPEMLKACLGKSLGDFCAVTGPRDRKISGTCFAPQDRPLACRPRGAPRVEGDMQSGPPPGGGGPLQFSQGAIIPGTQADTASVLCGTSKAVLNPTLGFESIAQWVCSGNYRALTSNGIPYHVTGIFPNRHNPNKISPQIIQFAMALKPAARTGAGVPVRISGYALNGVKFEPGTAARCPSGVTNVSQCDLGNGTGDWVIEALGHKSFNFGEDMNHAHVQPNGAYHYHGIPEGMLSASAKAGKQMALVGWASDGFPIYARYGRADAKSADSPLRVMQTSYRLKSKPDSGRPSIGLIPMGAFMQDFEYVKNLGDLDECNGRFDVTPEFPKGIYHYYATNDYPYVQRCVKGTPMMPAQIWTVQPGSNLYPAP